MGIAIKKIVILDGYPLNPGDLDWTPLRELGEEFVNYDRSTPEETCIRAADADVVFVNKVSIGVREIAALPKLKYIGVFATGYNIIDVKAARDAGIVVTNIPAYGTSSVAQHTFALLLELTNHVGCYETNVREGAWSRSQDFCCYFAPLAELSGKRFGIIGYGRIGREVGKLARAFGMEVLATGHGNPSASVADDGTPLLPLEELLKSCDVISIHCPLTADNLGMINAERLQMMKPGAILLNTARGPLVDSAALADALRTGHLGGAGIDVLDCEPPPADHPLLSAPNAIVTPHVAWANPAARRRLLNIAVDNLRAWQNGMPVNVVS